MHLPGIQCLMPAARDGDVGGVLHEVAGDGHAGREDVEERLDCCETAASDTQHYEQPAVDSLPLGDYSGDERGKVEIKY